MLFVHQFTKCTRLLTGMGMHFRQGREQKPLALSRTWSTPARQSGTGDHFIQLKAKKIAAGKEGSSIRKI